MSLVGGERERLNLRGEEAGEERRGGINFDQFLAGEEGKRRKAGKGSDGERETRQTYESGRRESLCTYVHRERGGGGGEFGGGGGGGDCECTEERKRRRKAFE